MAKRPELEVTTGELVGRRYAVPAGGLRLGRSSSNDLQLLDEELSRNHCLFEPDGESGIRVMDLASANGTFVNGKALDVEACVLKPGDLIQVGASELRVVASEATPQPTAPKAPVAAPASAPVAGASVVDLGLGAAPATGAEQEPAAGTAPSADAKRRKLLNIITSVVAGLLIVLVYGIVFEGWFFSPAPVPEKKQPAKTALMVAALPRSFTYERVEANAQKIVRYLVRIDGDEAVLTYDAQSVNARENQKLEERGTLTEYGRNRLDKLFESSEFLGLESVHGADPSQANALKSYRFTLVREGEVRSVAVENAPLSSELRQVTETFETLINNELAVQLSLRTPEECIASSQEHERLADDLLEKWEVEEQNMWEGVKHLKTARNELKGLSDQHEHQNRLQTKIDLFEARLKERYDALYGRGERARQIEDWVTAQEAYRQIRLLIPDVSDRRYEDAEAKLRDIEGRLEENRKGRRK